MKNYSIFTEDTAPDLATIHHRQSSLLFLCLRHQHQADLYKACLEGYGLAGVKEKE